MRRPLAAVPSALQALEEIHHKTRGKRLAVFLDYDGTLTPIVERPELAVLSDAMRETVRALAARCTVAVVSGRDRADVEALLGVPGLVVAGSHGFDIASPDGRSIQHEMGAEFREVLSRVRAQLREALGSVEGALLEPKRSSVAVHYRLVAASEVGRVKAAVDDVLAEHPELRVTPGKKVWEIQPRIDWDKGKAVLWLLESLDLEGADVLPFYLGDDVTDEDAFRALDGRGVSIYVGHPQDVESRRETVADYVLGSPDEVGVFLDALGRETG